jgi:hypothetical protein
MKQETQQQPGEEAPEVQRPKTRRDKFWERTGFGDKTAWDWMQLFIIPAVLVVGGYLLNSQQTARQLETEERRAEAQLEAEEERTQQEALQQYNNQMLSLILEEDLLDSQEGDAVRELARPVRWGYWITWTRIAKGSWCCSCARRVCSAVMETPSLTSPGPT